MLDFVFCSVCCNIDTHLSMFENRQSRILSQVKVTFGRKCETNKRSRGALLSRHEASVSSLLSLWLRPRSPSQHMSWPRVLTAVLRGFHQAPHDLPTAQTTAMLIVHCAAQFLQSASRILRSLTRCSILKVSYHSRCQVKPVREHARWIDFTAGPTSRCLAKIRLGMWLTWEASQGWSQAHF